MGGSVGRARGLAGQRRATAPQALDGSRLRGRRPSTSTRDLAALLERARAAEPDVVFNALHGRFGEDGCIQGVLELLGIPYTHSGVLASASRWTSRWPSALFAAAGLPLPRGHAVARAGRAEPAIRMPRALRGEAGQRRLQRRRAASCAKASNAPPVRRHELAVRRVVLVEDFIPGRELTVAVMGDRALAVTEMQAARRLLRLRGANTPTAARTICARRRCARTIAEEAMRMALVAHQTLGCRGVSRARLPLRRHQGRRRRQALSAGGQHPARHDAAVAGAGAGQASRHLLSRTGVLDGGGRRMRRLEAPAVKIARGRAQPGDGAHRPAAAQAAAAGVAALVDPLRHRLRRLRRRSAAARCGACSPAGSTARLGGGRRRRADRDRRCSASACRPSKCDGRGETPPGGRARRPRRAARRADPRPRHRCRCASALAALPWIVSAEVERRLPDRLVVTRRRKREPLALWQRKRKLFLVEPQRRGDRDRGPAQISPSCW